MILNAGIAARDALRLTLVIALAACDGERRAAADTTPARASDTVAAPVSGTASYAVEVLNRWPHDTAAFTQGLEFSAGVLYEGTGMYGRSSVRTVDLPTGANIRRVDLPKEHFGEGITVFRGKVYQLTWESRKGFVYDTGTLALRDSFPYQGEGWGLTHDTTSLIMSDGTSALRFLDPRTFAVKRTLAVTDAGQPVKQLNELEWVKGEIFANIWGTNQIARIDPTTGRVSGWIDVTDLVRGLSLPAEAVLNGVAYDEAADRLFVTGKLWPVLFEVRVKRVR